MADEALDGAVTLAEVWRGAMLESQHIGWAAVARADGEIVACWGDPAHVIYPRSSAKMLHALPLVESGAADARGLTERQLALACASHSGAAIHTEMVLDWLGDLGLSDDDLRCGAQIPDDRDAKRMIICDGGSACQCHNTCSGKHVSYLTTAQHLGQSLDDYIDPNHPLQREVRAVLETMAGEDVAATGTDGCSAPTFAVSLRGLATAMARMADPRGLGAVRRAAAARLIDAMRAHPIMVRGARLACTELMEATKGRAAVKFGAEGVYTAALPEQGLGIALKVADGQLRGAECAIAALLARLSAADSDDPKLAKYLNPTLLNRRGLQVGDVRPGAALWQSGRPLI